MGPSEDYKILAVDILSLNRLNTIEKSLIPATHSNQSGV